MASAIQELLEDLGIRFAVHGQSKHVTQGWVATVCPWCDRGIGNFGLGINLSNGACSCWSCGVRPLVGVLQALTNKPWEECRRLADGVRRGLRPERFDDRPRGVLKLPGNVGAMGRRHREYLRGRGFDDRACGDFWSLLATEQFSDHPWRLVWPVDVRERTVSWTSRGIGTEGYRAAGPGEEAVPLKSLLLGRDHVRHVAIVVEGPMDCMAVGPGAVCTFGVGYTQAQVNRLAEIPVRFVCFDQDAAGRRAATKLADDLAPLGGVTKVVDLDAADPGSASRRELARLRRLAFGRGDIGSPGRA